MKFLTAVTISAIFSSAFAEDDAMAKAYKKRREADCMKQMSDIRKRGREMVGLTEKIASQEPVMPKDKNDTAYPVFYLKLKSESICTEKLAKTPLGTVYAQYSCRDKSGKETLTRSVDITRSDCEGMKPKP